MGLWLEGTGISHKKSIITTLGDEKATMDVIISEFLNKEKDQKISRCLQDFSDAVLDEMTVSSSKYEERRHFLLFLRSCLASIREDMYTEFKPYLDDAVFDLYMRQALLHYEGVG